MPPGRPARSDLAGLLLDGEGAHVEPDHDGGVPAGVVPKVQHLGVRDQGQQSLVADKMVEGSNASVICVYTCVIYYVVIPETGQSQSVREKPVWKDVVRSQSPGGQGDMSLVENIMMTFYFFGQLVG